VHVTFPDMPGSDWPGFPTPGNIELSGAVALGVAFGMLREDLP
jgi:hypothetical protein